MQFVWFTIKSSLFFIFFPPIISYLICRLLPSSTLEMLIPANAVGKVMGKGGANIANIRKVVSPYSFGIKLPILFP